MHVTQKVAAERQIKIRPSQQKTNKKLFIICFVLAEAINKMKSEKVPGPDRIPPEAMKETAKICAEYLLDVMNEL